jgi:hypothetical protein
MQQGWYGLVSLSGSPFVLFAALLVLSHFFYRRYFLPALPLVANGGVVMTIGAFALVCLPQLKLPSFLTILIALELLIIWLYLAIELIQAYFQDDLVLSQYTEWVSLGTWVVGTVLTDLFLNEAEHTLHGVIVLLGLISLLLYLVYMGMMIQWLGRYVRKACHLYTDGRVLLVTVSTQAMALLLYGFFHEHLPLWFYQSFIILGLICYLIGSGMMLRYFVEARQHHLTPGCHNAYGLSYGALSITGWAMIHTQSFSNVSIRLIGLLTLLFFIAIILLDWLRLIRRIKAKGWHKGIWVYHPSQWLRCFALIMLYAFAHADGILLIASFGQYIIAVLLIIQIALALSHGSIEIIRETLCRK